MNLLRMVLAECVHRRLTSFLILLALVWAVATIDVFILLGRAAEKETRSIQRDIGLNVLILPSEANLDRYWLDGYSDHSMPEEYLARVEKQDVANRLIPLLQRRVPWKETDVLLTGISTEVFKKGQKKKAVFGRAIPEGSLVLGSAVGARLGESERETLELLGETFQVARVLSETGSSEDVRVYGNLGDVQRLLDLEGRISEIQAIECHCSEDVEDPLQALRAQLEPLLPGTQIVRRSQLADARREQRLMAERLLSFGAPIVLVLCGLWVASLSMLNVRERRSEIGLLHALGYRTPSIGTLLASKVVVLSLIAGGLGYGLAFVIATRFGPSIYQVSKGAVSGDPGLLVYGMLATPIFGVVAMSLPLTWALTQDPGEILSEPS